MGKLEEQADWGTLVHQAVDDFLEELERRQGQRKYEDLGSTFDVQSVAFREQLELYSATLLASARAGVGGIQCNNGDSTVDCVFVLRPTERPYFRCLGHSPPDCYDEDYEKIPCP